MRRSFGSVLLAAVLGCTLAPFGSAPAAASNAGVGRPLVRVEAGDAARSFVYGCSPFANACYVYGAKGKLIRTLTSADGLDAPAGTMASTRGEWYVANLESANVLVFAAGGTKLVTTLHDPGQLPADVAVAKRTIAVSNEYAGSPSSPGSVSVYVKGMVMPAYVLTAAGALQGEGVTFDVSGNCYWSYNTSPNAGGHIVAFAGCKAKAKAVDLGLTLGDAGGVAFDPAGNLWFTDQSTGLYECSGTSSCTLVASGFGDPLGINFDKTGTTLYLADTTFGIYAITGFDALYRPKVRPDYIVTPFSSKAASGVAAGPGD